MTPYERAKACLEGLPHDPDWDDCDVGEAQRVLPALIASGMSRLMVYVAGPMGTGDLTRNVRAAILAAEEIRRMGHAPYVPHLSVLWDAIAPVSYEGWMELDLAWLARCDVLLRLPGASPGADREVAEAERLGIPVVRSVKELEQTARMLLTADGLNTVLRRFWTHLVVYGLAVLIRDARGDLRLADPREVFFHPRNTAEPKGADEKH